jgi:hypothetical protein
MRSESNLEMTSAGAARRDQFRSNPVSRFGPFSGELKPNLKKPGTLARKSERLVAVLVGDSKSQAWHRTARAVVDSAN